MPRYHNAANKHISVSCSQKPHSTSHFDFHSCANASITLQHRQWSQIPKSTFKRELTFGKRKIMLMSLSNNVFFFFF